MYKKILLAAMLAALTQGCAGSANTAATNSDGTQTASTGSSDNAELICQNTRSTGSMLKNKRCRTREQIEADREEARNTMNSIHSSVAGSSGIERK
ncbi:hypothetical protein MN202_06940 [Rheinheimera muenzenbergensis]|uniref:Lipoprotein n=1 Tax=Rheinheimera muenzenbergensis TaxID=1193628 RepID=A0ABU8C4X0_9GAMM